ncbi:MAG: 30S ribosomal protein S24e [Candidatus Micrarchaeota archaeon]|nr:30S ribosomal protein S24e [Candidatus Micrarchaeota archaeon]MDE1804829.1 30S ribosomal protein S24e [Candidatus Micrarchaeota archaeon]MDE1847148.1 30S ribosomal protein S24e [Candidatus Micrarchaeota archaeon]
MDIKIEHDSENKLLGRKEIEFTISYKGATPTKEQVREAICKRLNISPELTVVVNISPLYGTSESRALAHSYSSKEAMAVEKKYLAERAAKKAGKAAKEEPKAEAKAEAKEEKPAEEKKE